MTSSLSLLGDDALATLLRQLLVEVPPESSVCVEQLASQGHGHGGNETSGHTVSDTINRELHRLLVNIVPTERGVRGSLPGAGNPNNYQDKSTSASVLPSLQEVTREWDKDVDKFIVEERSVRTQWAALLKTTTGGHIDTMDAEAAASVLQHTLLTMRAWFHRAHAYLVWWECFAKEDASRTEEAVPSHSVAEDFPASLVEVFRKCVHSAMTPLVSALCASQALSSIASPSASLDWHHLYLVWSYVLLSPLALSFTYLSWLCTGGGSAQERQAAARPVTSPDEIWLPSASLLLNFFATTMMNGAELDGTAEQPHSAIVMYILSPFLMSLVIPLEKKMCFHFGCDQINAVGFKKDQPTNLSRANAHQTLGPPFFFEAWQQALGTIRQSRVQLREHLELSVGCSGAGKPQEWMQDAEGSISKKMHLMLQLTDDFGPLFQGGSMSSWWQPSSSECRSGAPASEQVSSSSTPPGVFLHALREWWLPVVFSVGERLLTQRSVRLFLDYYRWGALGKKAALQDDSKTRAHALHLVLLSIQGAFDFITCNYAGSGLNATADGFCPSYLLRAIFKSPSVVSVWSRHALSVVEKELRSAADRRREGHDRRALLLQESSQRWFQQRGSELRHLSEDGELSPIRSPQYGPLVDDVRTQAMRVEDRWVRRVLLYPAVSLLRVLEGFVFSPLTRGVLPALGHRAGRVAAESEAWVDMMWTCVVDPALTRFLQHLHYYSGQGMCLDSAASSPRQWTDVGVKKAFLHKRLLNLCMEEQRQSGSCSAVFWRSANVLWIELESLHLMFDKIRDWRARLGEAVPRLEEEERKLQSKFCDSAARPGSGDANAGWASPSSASGSLAGPEAIASLLEGIPSRGRLPFLLRRQQESTCAELLQLCRMGMEECLRPLLTAWHTGRSSSSRETTSPTRWTSGEWEQCRFPSPVDHERSAWHGLEEFMHHGRCAVGAVGHPVAVGGPAELVVPLPQLWSTVEVVLHRTAKERLSNLMCADTAVNEMLAEDLREYLYRMGCPECAKMIVIT